LIAKGWRKIEEGNEEKIKERRNDTSKYCTKE
jgi:hypothetical protein